MLSVCPDLTGLSIIFVQGEAPVILWPIVPAIVLYLLYGMLVPTPPWHVTLEMTLSMRLTAGRQTSPCVPVSLPLPSLSVHCSSPSISASPHAVQVFTLSDS